MNANLKKGYSRDLTEFEWRVLGAALTIPFGQTRTYRWVAEQIGRPKSVRAVGQALRNNPFPLIVPCHRVIKSDGTPGGYAGRFDGKKARLLQQEKEIAQHIKTQGHKAA